MGSVQRSRADRPERSSEGNEYAPLLGEGSDVDALAVVALFSPIQRDRYRGGKTPKLIPFKINEVENNLVVVLWDFERFVRRWPGFVFVLDRDLPGLSLGSGGISSRCYLVVERRSRSGGFGEVTRLHRTNCSFQISLRKSFRIRRSTRTEMMRLVSRQTGTGNLKSVWTGNGVGSYTNPGRIFRGRSTGCFGGPS